MTLLSKKSYCYHIVFTFHLHLCRINLGSSKISNCAYLQQFFPWWQISGDHLTQTFQQSCHEPRRFRQNEFRHLFITLQKVVKFSMKYTWHLKLINNSSSWNKGILTRTVFGYPISNRIDLYNFYSSTFSIHLVQLKRDITLLWDLQMPEGIKNTPLYVIFSDLFLMFGNGVKHSLLRLRKKKTESENSDEFK